MNQEGSPTTPAKPPRRRRSVPLITSIIIILLAGACITEGFLLYLKQLQITASSQATEQAAGRIAKLEREKEDTENTLSRYYKLVGPGDLAELREQVRNTKPPTLRGYISELESKLTTTITKLDEKETGWAGMEKARNDAIQARAKAEVQLTQKTTEFLQRLAALTKQLQTEQEAHRKDLKALQEKVAEVEKDLKNADDLFDKAVADANQASRRNKALEAWYQVHLNKVRVLLARLLRVQPESVGLSPALLAADRLEITVDGAESAGDVPYVRFLTPQDKELETGMRFVIYDNKRRPKCLVQLRAVLPEKALAEVVQKYSQDPVKPGDLAELDLAFEELRKLPAPPSTVVEPTTGAGSEP